MVPHSIDAKVLIIETNKNLELAPIGETFASLNPEMMECIKNEFRTHIFDAYPNVKKGAAFGAKVKYTGRYPRQKKDNSFYRFKEIRKLKF